METEEHELLAGEAVMAATLALMTAYSQALQAELHPRQRLAMGRKIVAHLALLRQQPHHSAGFGEVLWTLQRCWQKMGACTREAGAGAGLEDDRWAGGAPPVDGESAVAPATGVLPGCPAGCAPGCEPEADRRRCDVGPGECQRHGVKWLH